MHGTLAAERIAVTLHAERTERCSMTLEPRRLRDAFGRFATGVTVVTCARDDGVPHGATANAFTAVSLEPALCQVTLFRRSKACGYLEGAPFAVNVLAADQLDVA